MSTKEEAKPGNPAVKTKKEELNFRETSPDDLCCQNCEHMKDGDCAVLNQEVKYETVSICDAWNSAKIENTWFLLLHPINDKLFMAVKEDMDQESLRFLGLKEVQMPVPSIDEKVIDFFEILRKQNGCPDFVCNITPKKFAPGKFKEWLEYRLIHYREMDAEIDTTKVPGIDEVKPAELLSAMIDSYYEGGANGE